MSSTSRDVDKTQGITLIGLTLGEVTLDTEETPPKIELHTPTCPVNFFKFGIPSVSSVSADNRATKCSVSSFLYWNIFCVYQLFLFSCPSFWWGVLGVVSSLVIEKGIYLPHQPHSESSLLSFIPAYWEVAVTM